MTILAFTGLVLSYVNALFSLLFLVWFIFALMVEKLVSDKYLS